MTGMALLRTVVLALLMIGAAPAMAQTPFYQATPQEIAGQPGTLIRSEPMHFAPAGAQAWRILYRSRGMNNEPIAVSGVAVIPPGAPPVNGRPIVAWAHPTTGVVPHCAPSLALFVFQQMQGLRPLIERGVVVVATDYPGLGTAGPHPYLVGTSEAQAVLDSVRVVRGLPNAGAGNSFAVWGHSQGGHAALYTGLLAKNYAPELNLVGVAAAAPATDLVTLMADDFKTSGGKNLTAMTLWSWARVFKAPLDKVVVPAAMSTVDQLANECIENIFDIIEAAEPGEGAGADLPVRSEHRDRRALQVAGRPQFTWRLAQGDPAFPRPGHDRQSGAAVRDPGLFPAPVQGGQPGHHASDAGRQSRLCRARRCQCRGDLDG